MNFRQAVLREFICGSYYLTDEPCIALQADYDPSELSSFHQMVKKPHSAGYTPEIVHAVVPQSQCRKALREMKKEFKYVTPVGETFCVAPYTIGFARLGTRDAEKSDQISHLIANKEYFPTYVHNWVDTTHGYNTMIDDIIRESEYSVSEDFIRHEWEDDDTPDAAQNLKSVKVTYVIDHAGNPKAPDYAEYRLARLDEFRLAANPISEKKRAEHIERYYALPPQEEDRLRRANTEHCKNTGRLLWGIWYW